MPASQSVIAVATRSRKILWLIPLMIVGCVLAVGGSVFMAAHREDALAVDVSRRITSAIFDNEIRQLVKINEDYGYWSDVIDIGLVGHDEDWLNEYLGSAIATQFDLDGVFVLSPRNQIVFASGPMVAAFRPWLTGTTLVADLSDLRQQLPYVQELPGERRPQAKSFWLNDGKEAYLVAMCLIAPNDERPKNPADGSVLIMARSLDRATDLVRDHFGIKGLVALPSGQLPNPMLQFESLDGPPISVLWSRPETGNRLLIQILPLALGTLILTLVVGLFLGQRFATTLSDLQDLTDAVKTKNDALHSASERAERANAAKANVIATMNQKIRTPLHGVLGLTDLLLDSPLEERQRLHAKSIRASADQLLTIVNDMLDLAKLEAGKLDLNLAGFDLAMLLADVVDVLTPALTTKPVTLSFSIEGDEAPYLLGDSRRLRQILLSLGDNAVQFTARGAIQLKARRVDQGPRWRFEIIDSGEGISPENQIGLFERYRQLNPRQANPRREGSGLGLAICRELVERMGGLYGFTSQVGIGSTFWFEVPLEDTSRARRQSGDDSRSPSAPRRILLVEETQINQQIAQSYLESTGFQVTLTDNGLSAIDLAKTTAFDLILIDVQLSDLDGMATTRRIRAEASLNRNCPIVALTSDSLAGERDRCLAAGMDDFLTKPIRPQALAALIEKWLSRKA